MFPEPPDLPAAIPAIGRWGGFLYGETFFAGDNVNQSADDSMSSPALKENMKFYVKNSKGRYEEFADRWEGFPCDGWWCVADGRQNLVVPIDAPRPLQKLRYQQYRNEIVDRLTWESPRSLYQLVEDVLDLLEEIVEDTPR